MADLSDDDALAPGLPRDAQAAWAVLGAASRDKADRFLEKQVALTDYQIEQLRQYDHFEVSHLRWRRFNDHVKGVLQIMLLIVGALILVGIGTAMWNASRADGIEVEAFSVPPSFVQAGIAGDVVADDLTGKIVAIRDFANQNSISRSKDVRQEGDEIKVEIPQTGISLSQAWRYLRLWLGNERRLSGHLRTLADGRIALDVALAGETFILEGTAGELDKLEQRAAEMVFAKVDPLNIVFYLVGRGRLADALAAAERLTHTFAEAPLPEHSDSYAVWAAVTHFIAGDPDLAIARARIGIALDPKTSGPHMEVMTAASDLGHDEEALRQARIIQGNRREDEQVSLQGNGFDRIVEQAMYTRDLATGDFAQAMTETCDDECPLAERLLRHAEYTARLHDPAHARALIAQALAGGEPRSEQIRARYFVDTDLQDWGQAAADARAYAVSLRDDNPQSPRLGALLTRTQAQPLLAEARARGGDFAAAHAAIEGAPRNCYNCARVRGVIRAAEKKWGAAQFWFAQAVQQAPSLPFAYADWGAMLLAKGDADGAIAKFALANQAAPHFADALEGWGEALMAKNRSDLALAKFAEAEKYAPNWRRLHLKWGEALAYAGKPDEAKRQLALTASLEGNAADAAELGAVRAKAGL